MIELTQSLARWLFDNHRDIFPLVTLGHTELVTDEMWDKYTEWCNTEEGRKYLKGGEKYKNATV